MIKSRQSRANSSLDIYLQEIGEVPLLSPGEEVELARRIRQGDEEALEKLTTANLRFVVSVTKQYQNRGLSFADLINEGNVGLIKAARRFDETRGFKFISYAVWWIRQSIQQALAEHSRVVRLPLNRIGTLNRISKACGVLEQEFGRDPSISEIAEQMELETQDVIDHLSLSGKQYSLDAPMGHDSDTSLLDVVKDEHQSAPDARLAAESLQEEIRKALDTLTEREARVIRLYFGLDNSRSMNLEEIGNQIHLTRERVRQIKEKGLKKLRRNSRSGALQQYLG
ncbi:RNA polymerase sigma factor RpoD/SigA [bacterium]|nr:RNA polymerase sigma factor RpoD/SigA [bacterium]